MSDPTRPAVRLDDISKAFGDAYAVRDVTLDIAAGEFFSLLGPSGCGKTTSRRASATSRWSSRTTRSTHR